MKELESALVLVAGVPAFSATGSVSPSVVDRAEEILGLKLPPTYRVFLQELGCLELGNEDVYGIIDQDLLRGPVPNAIWTTIQERSAGMSSRFFILQDTGYGGWYALDTAVIDSLGECPVVQLSPGLDHAFQVSTDFGTYLLERVKWAVEKSLR